MLTIYPMCDKHDLRQIQKVITHTLSPVDDVAAVAELTIELFGVLVTMTGGGSNGGACDPRLLAGGRDEIRTPGGTVVLVITGVERDRLPVGKMAALEGDERDGMIRSDAGIECQVCHSHLSGVCNLHGIDRVVALDTLKGSDGGGARDDEAAILLALSKDVFMGVDVRVAGRVPGGGGSPGLGVCDGAGAVAMPDDDVGFILGVDVVGLLDWVGGAMLSSQRVVPLITEK